MVKAEDTKISGIDWSAFLVFLIASLVEFLHITFVQLFGILLLQLQKIAL